MDRRYTIGIDPGAGDDVTAISYRRVDDGAIVVDILQPGRAIEGECVRISPPPAEERHHG